MAMTPMPTPAPSRTMSQADFDEAVALHVAALPVFISGANTLQTDVNAKQATASAAATTATTQAGLASDSASAASGSASSASGSATTATNQATAAAASAASAAAIAGAFVGTSTTNLLIEVASKTFATQADEQYAAGQWVTAVSAANGANNMYGQVTSYSGTTLIVDIQVIGGSGTFADWNLSIAGVRGATGAAGTLSGTAAGTIDLLTGANIASVATINLDTATGNRVHVTGTTTITAVTLTRGPRTVIFDGILTLTHHATNNKLPGGANITTAAGDVAVYEGDGTTVRCAAYTKSSGLPVVAASVSVGDHEVVVHTGNAHGSTNTKIRRFTTAMTNVGTAITYADSATLGATFTINEAGLYSIHYSDMCSIGSASYGVSVNSTELTTSIVTTAIANRLLLMTTPGTSAYDTCSRTVKLSVGDVVRPHTQGENSSTTNQAFFAIRKVGV